MVPITCNAVGDIMSLAEFAYNIVKALDESRGSTANYRELCDDFRSFSQVIECAAKAQENLPQSQDQVAYTKALEQGMGKFRRALGDVSEIVQQYEHTLGGGARGFRGIVAKLRWQFFTRSKIGPAKARIMECQSIITNIMVSNIVFKSSLPANVEDFSDSRDAIMLTDVLGDTLSIPWYQCQSWEMFHGILCVLFKGKAGKTYVQSRLYEIAQIVSMSKSLGITPEAWDVTVRRGMRVEMSVIVRRSEEEGQTGRTVRCLRCHKEMKQTRCRSRHYRDEWMTCSYCSARLQMGDQPETVDVEEESGQTPTGHSSDSSSSESVQIPDRIEGQRKDEMIFFRKVRVVTLTRDKEVLDDVWMLSSLLNYTRRTHLFSWSDTTSGPPHARLHIAQAILDGQVIGEGRGRNQTPARNAAAAEAYPFVRSLV